MSGCIFCKIVKGQIPCYKVYEDKDFLGFLDINPFNLGHSLIIPKKHIRWVWQKKNIGEYWQVANRVALAAMETLGAFTVCFATAGFEIAHAHIHVIPRFKNDGHGEFLLPGNTKKISEKEMQKIAANILQKTKDGGVLEK